MVLQRRIEHNEMKIITIHLWYLLGGKSGNSSLSNHHIHYIHVTISNKWNKKKWKEKQKENNNLQKSLNGWLTMSKWMIQWIKLIQHDKKKKQQQPR